MHPPSDDLGLREQITGLSAHSLTLPEFNRWFGAIVLDAEADASEDAWEIYLAVENVLAEWTGGHLCDVDTVQALRQIAEPVSLFK